MSGMRGSEKWLKVKMENSAVMPPIITCYEEIILEFYFEVCSIETGADLGIASLLEPMHFQLYQQIIELAILDPMHKLAMYVCHIVGVVLRDGLVNPLLVIPGSAPEETIRVSSPHTTLWQWLPTYPVHTRTAS